MDAFSTNFNHVPPAVTNVEPARDAEGESFDTAVGALGLGADFGEHAAKQSAGAFELAAHDLQRAGAALRPAGPDLSGDLTDLLRSIDSTAGEFRSAATTAEKTAKTLG